MTDPLQWHRDERDSLRRQIAALASGRVRPIRFEDGSAEQELAALRIRLLKLERLLGARPPLATPDA